MKYSSTNDFKGKGSSSHGVDAMQRHKRGAVFLFIALLVLNPWAAVLASANGQGGSVNVFAGGFSTIQIDLQGATIDNATAIDMPRNVTFDTASFLIKADAATLAPVACG